MKADIKLSRLSPKSSHESIPVPRYGLLKLTVFAAPGAFTRVSAR